MPGLGTLVNSAAIVVGAVAGTLLRRGIPAAWKETILAAMGLCVTVIGMKMAQGSAHLVLVVVSLALGALVGEALDLDGRLERLGQWVEGRFPKGQGALSQGFVTGSLLFCVGAMTLVGSLEAGLTGNNETLYTKSLLDLVSSSMLAAGMGAGVLLAALVVLVGQGSLVLLAGVLAPLLSQEAVTAMSAVGSLLILGLGLNLVGATKIKVANYLPAILLAPVVQWIFTLF